MTGNTLQTKALRPNSRGAGKLMVIAWAIAMSLFCQPKLNAQTMIGYMQEQKGDPIPANALKLGDCPSIDFNLVKAVQQKEVLCGFGPFTLPNYAGSVYVGFSGNVPALSWAHQKVAENQATSNGKYRWGNDTDAISLYNTSANTVNYTIHFYFNGPAPSSSDLFLVVAGLGSDTTATVSGEIGPWPGTGRASLSAQNGGEYAFPGGVLWCAPYCVSTSPTSFGTSWGALTFSSGYYNEAQFTTDPLNTGWDVYQPNAAGLGELSLDVQQMTGDGIDLTLGYRVCTTLIGNDLDSRSNLQMYDISTVTGAATNPRVVGANWELAFSPVSAEGTLYALVGNTLYSVNPASGVPTKLTALTPAINGSNFPGLPALAADPTNSSVMYAINNGNLFTVSSTGAVSPTCAVPGASGATGLAFDSTGDMFVVEGASNAVLQVNKSNCAIMKQLAPSGLLRWSSFAQLAIDPATGHAYYAEGGYLYTIDLTTGALSSPLQVTGTEDNGSLFSLTFTVGACVAPGPIL